MASQATSDSDSQASQVSEASLKAENTVEPSLKAEDTVEALTEEETKLKQMEDQLDHKIENFTNPTEVKQDDPNEEEIFKKFYEQLEKLEPEERAKVLRYFREKQAEIANPEKTKYSTIHDNQRKSVLERFKMRKASLAVSRKSVTAKKHIAEKHVAAKLQEPTTDDAAATPLSKSKKRRMKLKEKSARQAMEASTATTTYEKPMAGQPAT